MISNEFCLYLIMAGQKFTRNISWRLGQSAFNVLVDWQPELAEKIRGTSIDPFHKDDRLSDFFTFVESNWKNS